MDAFNVALPDPQSCPRPVCRRRDERGIRAGVHAAADDGGKQPAWRLGNNVINALARSSRASWSSSGIVFARPLVGSLRGDDYASVPGKLELTVLLTRIMLPFLTLGGASLRR